MNELVMFTLQGLLTLVIFFFGVILSGMRSTMQRASDGMENVAKDLRALNNAVLGEYVTRNDSDSKWTIHRTETDEKWKAQRILDHELRSLITDAMIDIAKVSGKPYNYGGDKPA